MPIFEYRCKKCGKSSEHLVRNRSEAAITCSACGSKDVERLMSAPSAPKCSREGGFGQASCGSDITCCGRGTPCSIPPCSED